MDEDKHPRHIHIEPSPSLLFVMMILLIAMVFNNTIETARLEREHDDLNDNLTAIGIPPGRPTEPSAALLPKSDLEPTTHQP